jgi:hypothetical protein
MDFFLFIFSFLLHVTNPNPAPSGHGVCDVEQFWTLLCMAQIALLLMFF